MSVLTGTVNMHKRSLHRLINLSDVTLQIRLPVTNVAGTVNPLFGDLSRENNKTGDTVGPFNCLWYDAISAKSMGTGDTIGIEKVIEASPGQFREATAFAELWLQDVLIDQNDPLGPTWFDRALNVISLNRKYKVLGYAKLGLSVSVPYSLMVALKGGLGYDDN